MRKIKVIFTSVVSTIVCLHLIGYFNVVKIFAAEDFVQVPPQEPLINLTNPSDAQEEGAADILDNQDSFGESSVGEEGDPEVIEEAQLPQVKSFAPIASSAPTVAELSLPPTPDVVVNEFMANPEGTDTGNEWVEIYNKEDSPVDITGWSIKDAAGNTYYVAGTSILLGSKGFYIINNVSNLNNSGDETIELLDSFSTQADVYNYNGADSGISQGRYPDGSSNLADFNHPTPGSPNYLGPIAGTVRDGVSTSLDIDYSNDNTALSANWSGFSDPVYSIDHYEYAFGTTVGGTDVTSGWLTTSEVFANFSASLAENQTYYASVKAVNSESMESNVAKSDGVKIDTIAPQVIDVEYEFPADDNDGIYRTGQEIKIHIFIDEVNIDDAEVLGTFNGKNIQWQLETVGNVKDFVGTYMVASGEDTEDALLDISIIDPAGNQSYYNEDSGIVIDTIAPTAPGSISVISGSDNIQINWEASGSEDVFGYNIYRASSPYVKLNQDLLPITQTNYIDKDIEENVIYHYKVTAVDVAGNETLLDDAIESQAIEITAVTKVVGQILDEGLKTYQPQSSGFVSKAYAAESKVEGEKSVETEDQNEATTEEESATNWPLIIALIVAGLIVLSGIWYYWVVTRNMEENSSQSVRIRRKRRTSRSRSGTQSRKPKSRRSRRGR